VVETDEQWTDQVHRAMSYTDKIVVPSDGYPMTLTESQLKTLLVNAFIAGENSAWGMVYV
jgi:hypothetical protein